MACEYRLNQWAIPYPIINLVLKSPDGIVWSRSIVEQKEYDLFKNIIYTGKEYIVNSKYYSIDAKNWSIVEGNGTIYNASTNSILLLKLKQDELSISNDGVNWTFKGKSETLNGYKKILWNGKVFVGLREWGRIFKSIDGLNWETALSNEIVDICWNRKICVASVSKATDVSNSDSVAYSKDGNKVYISTDGIEWSV